MRADAIIAGAGIIGAAIAHELSAAGLDVIVLDESFPGTGATAVGMGHVVLMDGSPAQLALTSLSRDLLDALAPALPASCELDRCGTLWLAEDDIQLDAARAKVARCQAAGVSAELVDAVTLRGEEPNLRDGLAGAAFVPGDSILSPPALCAFLLDSARTRGARLHPERAVRLEPHAVVTASGRLEAPIIINAAGVHAPALVPGLPVVPRKGYLVLTSTGARFCRHQLVELDYMHSAHTAKGATVAFNVQPRAEGHLLIGSSRELVGLDASIRQPTVTRMLDRAAAFMPGISDMVPLRTWCGFRPATPDNLPLIGPWDPVSGLWIATGHEGLGITTALGTAHVLADQLLGRTPAIDALPFAPARIKAAPYAR